MKKTCFFRVFKTCFFQPCLKRFFFICANPDCSLSRSSSTDHSFGVELAFLLAHWAHTLAMIVDVDGDGKASGVHSVQVHTSVLHVFSQLIQVGFGGVTGIKTKHSMRNKTTSSCFNGTYT